MNPRKVLFLSSLPPPLGGISVWTKRILDRGLPGGWFPVVVNTALISSAILYERKKHVAAEVVRNISIMGRYLAALRREKPALVYINSSLSRLGVFRELLCTYVAKAFSKAVLTHYRANMQDHCRKFPGRWFLKMLASNSRVNWVSNVPSETALKKILHPRYHHTVSVMCDFIDEEFCRHFESPLRTTEKKRLRALYVGGVTTSKGCSEIIRVAREFPQVEFVFVGKATECMKGWLQDAPSNIVEIGLVTRDQLPSHLSSADIFIFPTYTEGFPGAVIEAMSAGLPVLSTRVGAIPEMIDPPRGGILVEPRDVRGLASGLRRMIDDPDMREAMGRYNRQKVMSHYTYSNVTQKMMNLIEASLQ